MSEYLHSEVVKAVSQMAMIATVTQVDAAAARVKVTFGGESESDWLPWLAERAGGIRVWAPISVGEQVFVVSPIGQTQKGVVVGSIFSGASAAPSGDGAAYKLAIGGSSVTVTGDQIILESNGSTVTLAASGVTIEGAALEINTGTLKHNGIDVGETHTHTGVVPGAAQSGPPA